MLVLYIVSTLRETSTCAYLRLLASIKPRLLYFFVQEVEFQLHHLRLIVFYANYLQYIYKEKDRIKKL